MERDDARAQDLVDALSALVTASASFEGIDSRLLAGYLDLDAASIMKLAAARKRAADLLRHMGVIATSTRPR